MLATLRRDQIVGQRIRALLVTPEQEIEGVSVAAVFVLLENGNIFELQSVDPLEELPIESVPVSSKNLYGVQEDKSANGDVIKDVVASEYWPTIGLLLESNRFVFVSDVEHRRVGLAIIDVGSRHDIADVITYWGKQPLHLQ